MLIEFYIACSDYLIENLLIDGQVVANARYLHPLSQKSPNAFKGISRLASAVVNCLGEEKAREVFKQKKVKPVLIISLTKSSISLLR